MSEQNWQDYAHGVHALGSSAAMFGASGLANMCRASEAAFKAQDLRFLTETSPRLNSMIMPSLKQVEAWLAAKQA